MILDDMTLGVKPSHSHQVHRFSQKYGKCSKNLEPKKRLGEILSLMSTHIFHLEARE